jgi:hypothetical protein
LLSEISFNCHTAIVTVSVTVTVTVERRVRMSKRYSIEEIEALTAKALSAVGFPAEDVGIVTEVSVSE